MATMFIPTIAPADYETFRGILHGDFPNTYDKWLQLTLKMSTDNVGMGHISEPIKVDPHEFARYLRATGASASRHALELFAHEKGMGKEY